ncbi:hypothetical protein [Alkaliphilus sp. B6464]|uniref:hypothetical protein n=1 Tax=Alkaliphilus sp. B6464 TaxID=2731219 RepID=UPI001BA61946|nr:hypothetical protein [Alkaliphilus sp. B6464]QUH21807.1 hypothetical protein HYG84_17885 [Alkaliphilus sp. B6464]
MIELFNSFKKLYNKLGDKMLMDAYEISPGLYLRINKDGNIDKRSLLLIDAKLFKQEKKEEKETDRKERLAVLQQSELYNWYKLRDINSNYITNNKAVDSSTKKTLSNNCFTFFIKRENIFEENEDLNKKGKINYFIETFENYYENLIQYANEDFEIRTTTIANKDILLKNIEMIKQISNDNQMQNGSLIKIFFDASIETYSRASDLYYFPNRIFGNTDYNEQINGGTIGANSFSMNLNSRKPFLLMNTTSFKVPYIVNSQDAYLYEKMKMWLKKAPYKFTFGELAESLGYDKELLEELKIPLNIYFEKEISKTGITVGDYDILNTKNDMLYPFIEFNILRTKDYQDIIVSGVSKEFSRSYIKWIINLNFFDKKINEFMKAQSRKDLNNIICSNALRTAGMNYIKGLVHYFNKNEHIDISTNIDRITGAIIKDKIISSNDINIDRNRIKYLFDLRVSLMNFFDKKGVHGSMATTIKDIYNEVSNKFESLEIAEISNDEEFYFVCGQVYAYLISKSKATKNGRLLSPIITARTSGKIKEVIRRTYKRYSHELLIHPKLDINKAIQMVMDYIPKDEGSKKHFYKDLLMAGLIGNNMFYRNKKSDKTKSLNKDNSIITLNEEEFICLN